MRDRPRFSLVHLLFWLAISYAPAATGIAFQPDHWWRRITKPSWTPPDQLFGPVWLVLYFLIGVAVYRVARRNSDATPGAVTWFFVQLVLNALWTPLFFGMHRPDLALVCIALLWLAIVGMIRSFARIDGPAAALLVPYLLWVSFASALNAAIWWLNR